MANIKSAKKRVKTSEKNYRKNVSLRSKMRTLIKKVKTSIEKKDQGNAYKKFKEIQSFLDMQSTKGLIHRNKSARHKSKLMNKIKKIQGMK